MAGVVVVADSFARNRYLGRLWGGVEGRYDDEYHCW